MYHIVLGPAQNPARTEVKPLKAGARARKKGLY